MGLAFAFFTLLPPVHGQEANFSFFFSNRANALVNFLNTAGSLSSTPVGLAVESPLNLRFENDQIGYSFLAGVVVDASLGSGFSLGARIDSGESKYGGLCYYQPDLICSGEEADPRCGWTANGRKFSEEASASFFVRELYVAQEAAGGAFSWWAGKRRVLVGEGFVLDNYALGGGVAVDLEEAGAAPLRFSLAGVIPNGDFTEEGKKSPLVHFEAVWPFGMLEELSLWSAWFHDGDSALSEMLLYGVSSFLLSRYLIPRYSSSRGNFFWVGLSGNKLFARATLSWTAAIEFGWANLVLTLRNAISGEDITYPGSLRALGGMTDVSFHYDVTDWFTPGLFFLYLSGEAGQRQDVGGSYGSFISVYPYITRTSVFFNGGINQNFSARSLGTAGINGRGVLAPGLTLGVDITEKILLRLCGALLFSQGKHAESGSRYYGIEADLNLEWIVTGWFSALLEAGYFHTGSFFDFPKPLESAEINRHFTKEPDAWKVVLGLDFYYDATLGEKKD